MENTQIISKWLKSYPNFSLFTTKEISQEIFKDNPKILLKRIEKAINKSELNFNPLDNLSIVDEHGRKAKQLVLEQQIKCARKSEKLILFAQIVNHKSKEFILGLNDYDKNRFWIKLNTNSVKYETLKQAFVAIAQFEKRDIQILPSGKLVEFLRKFLKKNHAKKLINLPESSICVELAMYSHGYSDILETTNHNFINSSNTKMTHLDRLESESIHIIREVMAEADNPVMLYSIGKDSSVMLHLARKAFYPNPPPFPLLHIDTRWKFKAMYDFRDYISKEVGMDMLVYVNQEGVDKNINPFDHGSSIHTDIMKTQSLKLALEHYHFDVAFGGARRDEEKSRAKERVFSFRTSSHRWDPKNQRPELWSLYNGKKNQNESLRVFPISNWTELDVWLYIYRENIPIVPLYFAHEQPVVNRDNMLIMVDDDRFPLKPNENIKIKRIRFRTLGCYPLTGAIESSANNLEAIILEILSTNISERQGRAIDVDNAASMEIKKQEGYF